MIAVEAKVNENFGPRLREKRSVASPGQIARLNYLQTLLSVSSFDESIRYQLLHRTASALLTARQFHARTAVLLIHSFGSKLSLRDDFIAFCSALKASDVAPNLFWASSFDAPRLFLGWCDGDEQFLQVELPSAEI